MFSTLARLESYIAEKTSRDVLRIVAWAHNPCGNEDFVLNLRKTAIRNVLQEERLQRAIGLGEGLWGREQ